MLDKGRNLPCRSELCSVQKMVATASEGGHLMEDVEKLLRAAKDALDSAMELYGVADDHDNPYIAFQIGVAWAYINEAMGLEGEDDGN